MEIKKKREEYIYKFRCECGKLLGGVNKSGYVVSYESTKHYTSLSGDQHIFICENRKNGSQTKCLEKTEIDMVEIRKKLRNPKYNYID
nr:hypothetical protein [uncultured Cetobacterium sp.]